LRQFFGLRTSKPVMPFGLPPIRHNLLMISFDMQGNRALGVQFTVADFD
jgi:hypothetical protein